MATFDLGRVTPLYKGDYSASASYELNDVVLYNGNLYWHVQATATVGILPTDTTVWKLAFADEGVRAEIRGYADDAQASKTAAATSASQASASASNASASASQASASAQSASTKASEASTSAQTASTKASEASTSAQSAASEAQTATDKATLASQKAQAASESASLATAKANAAATSETNAAASAQTASAKASEAAASATSAQEYDESAQASAVNAQTAQTAAETAQTAAETAQGLAEDAAESVSASAAQIATNTADITDLKEDLSHKANTDGYYADLVSGGSTQLLSDMVETDTTPYNYRTAGGSLEIGDRMKLKKIVGGSLAVNQLVQNGNFADGTTGWKNPTITSNTISVSDGVITASDSNGTAWFGFVSNNNGSVIVGHKYIATMDVKASIDGLDVFNVYADDTCLKRANSSSLWVSVNTSWKKLASVFNCIASGYASLGCRKGKGSYGSELSIYGRNVNLFDLTVMFGTTIADYVYSLETATAGAGVEWLKAHFPRIFDSGYIPYNAGTLEHVSGLSAHKMTGFNQWDEQWELGTINASSGLADADNTRIRAKNYNQCLPNTVYYVKDPTSNNNIGMRFYDADKNYLGHGASQWIGDTTFTTPANCAYFKFVMAASYGTTYNHDICINFSWDGERDGEYEPYEEHSYPLDDSLTLRGFFKLDSNNNLYADGDTYEYTGKVTRNTILRAYQSGDESLANAITDGTNTVVYSANASTEQATPYQHLQQCDPSGTEEYVSTGIVPIGHNSFYPENLRAKVEQLPWNFSSLIAPTESTFTATRNYTTGALFIVDNVLYKATSNIANGGTITPNTNCTATTLAEIISALA